MFDNSQPLIYIRNVATLFQKTKGGNWYMNYRWQGKQYKVSTKTKDKKLAANMLKEIEVNIYKGQHNPIPEEKRKKKNSIAVFFRRYIGFSESTKSPATNISDIYRIRQMQQYFARAGLKYLEDITPSEIQKFQTFIRSDHNERSYNNYLNLLKSIMNKAVEWGVIQKNPIRVCKPLKIAKKVRYFSFDEIKKLRDAAKDDIKLLLEIALYAGLRRAEMYYLRWEDIDFKRKIIHIRAHGDFVPKNKLPGTVPINVKLLKSLKEARAKKRSTDDGQYVFEKFHKNEWINPTSSISKAFARLAKKAGIKDASPHVCRHTFASHLVQEGTPLLVVKELMRHSDIKSTMMYAHLAPEIQRKAVENLKY